MTPKEEALRIFDKYYILILHSDSDLSEEILVSEYAKKCALVAVDEIYKAIHFDWMEEQNLERQRRYWNEVKNEIEQL